MARKPASHAEQLRVALRVYTALDLMSRGEAMVEEWRDLSDGINIIESLCDIGKTEAAKHMPAIEAASEGMVEAMEFFGELGRMRMNDRALEALKDVIGQYDLAISRFSMSTLAAARSHFVVKVARAKTKPDPSVRVVG